MSYKISEVNQDFKLVPSITVPQVFCDKRIDILTHNEVTSVMYETPHNSIYDVFFVASKYNVGLEITPTFIKCMIIAGLIRHFEQEIVYKKNTYTNAEWYREFFVDFEGKRSIEIMSVNGVLDFKAMFCELPITPESKQFMELFFVNELSPTVIYILLLVLMSNYFDYTVEIEQFMVESIQFINDNNIKPSNIEYNMDKSCYPSHFNIKGELSDWDNIRVIIKTLKKVFDMSWWCVRLELLIIHLKKIISDDPFKQFLMSSIVVDDTSTLFTGWVKNFFPYLRSYGNVYSQNVSTKIPVYQLPEMTFKFQYMIKDTDLKYYMMQTNISFTTISYTGHTLTPNILWLIESKGHIQNPILTTKCYGTEYEEPDESYVMYCDVCKLQIQACSYGFYSLNVCVNCIK